jgi:nitroreductase
MDLDTAIKSRRSVRHFTNKTPDWRDIIECIDSARYAPMAGKNFILKFILIDDPEKIIKISEYCQQDFIAEAQYVVVVCSDDSRIRNMFGERGKEFVKQESGAAIENFLLKIVEKGLSTCWVGHFVEDEIKHLLKIPEKSRVEALFPIGYEAKKPLLRNWRIELDRILFFNEYKNKKMKEIKKVYS